MKDTQYTMWANEVFPSSDHQIWSNILLVRIYFKSNTNIKKWKLPDEIEKNLAGNYGFKCNETLYDVCFLQRIKIKNIMR